MEFLHQTARRAALKVACLSIGSLLAAFALSSGTATAHGIWIEAPAVVAVGETAKPEIYFGEYHEEQREVSGGRLDERRGVHLDLTSLSGATQALALKQMDNHFVAQTQIDKAGIYHLLAADTESPVEDLRKYGIGVVRPFYYARREILAFKKGAVSERSMRKFGAPALQLDILPVTQHIDIRSGKFSPVVGEEVVFQVFFDGQLLKERAAIHVYSPTGWLWEAKLGSRGMDTFTPPWPGLYIVEVVYLKKEPGEFKGTAYEAERHRATLAVSVRERPE